MFKCTFALGTVAIEAVHALHLGGVRGDTTFISSTRGKIKKPESLGKPNYNRQRRLPRPGSSKRLETIVFRAGHCLSKARFLALLTRGVDLGIWFALAQGAVDRQAGFSLMAI